MSTDLGDKQPEVQSTDSSTEDYTTVPVSSTSMAVFPVIDMVPGKPREVDEDSLHSLSEQVTTRPTAATTGITVTHYISTVRITTSQASGTLKTLEPKVYHDVHHIPSPDKNIPASDIIPPSETTPYTTSPPTASSTAQKAISSLPEGEVIQSEDASGDEGDFVFSRPDESSVIEVESSLNNRGMDIPPKDEKSEGAPQGILDRKEVLGGVIAGGLVGLLFAGFLVGFMLYRMKKKDEGSYSLDEPKQSNGGYQKPHKQEEFYA
ncbi:hypothetical protein JD844_023722 [Phrynosoma platyrhinos]|uniref:Syndecan n=1 Tax=Phrynosoma platyrhinos TaxID=52577 RepID=A0ABQ7SXI0_PHRPL|nr:hypothetical protein JD844_023722 [Phrynosoma platyrhinos]